MNADEARVPNVEPDWSIEIFLFSNGQQFSPPRKYYLRADELNSWQATLNYLATSHFGLQCPQIRLFTTDGQLVEGPLGLNGGQAYVAVVEPDKFVNTGYQKYLIKASRSWEKRQARKKDTEFVPDEPCCLCPVKEWCSDPRTCCICLENEDLHSQYPLLRVPEHLELTPADEHYNSSTRTKPVARGDFRPGSGVIGPTSGEHEVRSGESETGPVQYRYSPAPAPAKPDQQGADLSVNGANPAEQAPKLSGNETRPGEYRAKSDESGTKLDESTGRPGENEVNLNDHAARFNESGAEPGEYGAKMNEYRSRLSQNGERPVEYLATLSENEPRLSKDVVKPGVYGARPDENVPRPADYQNRPSQNGVKPDEYRARPGGYKPRPIGKGITPDKYGAKPGGYETRPNRNEARPGEHISRPSVNRAKPREYVPKASEYKPRSNANGDKLSKQGVIPSEHEARPSVHSAQPGEYGTKQGEYAIRPNEYETRLSVNGFRPGEHEARPGEHETRPSINRAEARLDKNEVWSGEDVDRPTVYGSRAANEFTRRISGQRGTDIQQGGRMGEPTREFEHGGRVSEQKGRETNFAGRDGGQRVRLSEQRNKQSDLLPRLGGRESKLGDLEARPGDNGLKTIIDRNTSLENPVSRVTEPRSRTAAPVSRPSPRDRINSRTRTSDLGQPKSRTPTSVDETAARLDDSGIKNTVGHPRARLGSAGGTAVAGALHTSDAQQHARRSNLLAGRPSTEKKHLPIGQNSTLLKKPTLISSALRKLEDKQPIKTKQEIPTKKANEKTSVVSASTDVLKSKTLPECSPVERSQHELTLIPLPTISITNLQSPTTNKAPLENTIDKTDNLTVSKHSFHIIVPESEMTMSMRFDSIKYFVDAINFSPRETQTEIMYIGKSSASNSTNVEVQTSTETVDTKQQAQEESASNKAKADSETFQTSTEAVDTKQHAQEESASNKAKVNSETFQTIPEAVDTKQHEQEESAINKAKVNSEAFQTITEAVDTKQHAQEESAINKAKVNSEAFQTITEAVDTKQHAQEESAINKAKVNSEAFQTITEAVDTKQHAQEESAINKAKVNSEAFQTITEAVDTKQHAQEESAINKAKVNSEAFQTITEAVDTKQHAQEESAINKAKVNSEAFQTITEAVDTKQHAQEESVSNKAKVDSDTIEYNTGAVDTKQHAQDNSASNNVKVDSDARCLCSQRDHKPATGDPDENTVPIVYQSDGGTINLKLDIKIRNTIKSVYSCQKNCNGVRSVTNMTSEKESQISIEDNFLYRRDSFNSLFLKNYSRGYGFDFSPNVMVVQCAGCGRLNNPPGCDPTQCCNNNKKYFVLLTNSADEDMDDSCPNDQKQTQLKKQNSIIPVKKSYSEMNNSQNLETITTVTISGVPLQNREMKKCCEQNSSCQTEETHDCMISKHKVSITEESITTPTSEIQKKSSSSSVSLTTKRSRLKVIEEICPEIKKHESSLVYSQTDPVPCQKVPSTCIKVPSACTKVSSQTCPKVQSMGCQQTCPLVQTQGCCMDASTCPPVQTQGCCMDASTCPPVQTQGCCMDASTCPSCYPVPLACIQIQTHVCPHRPQVCNMETQTQWKSLVLQARLHCDGRYSFHLPPLDVLNNFPF